MTKLSVNLNKFALLRNSRGTDVPNVLDKARSCISFGVHGITVHPRPDQRHTKYSDVYELAALLNDYSEVEFNVEGNPVPRFLEVVKETKPDQCTLVPDAVDQLTSDHGWNITREAQSLEPIIQDLQNLGIRVSLFMDTDLQQIELVKKIAADRIELYTEPYADAFGNPDQPEVLSRFTEAAKLARQLGLGVNAGHDLSLKNLDLFLRTVPDVLEVSIGHAIVVESFDYSLKGTIEQYIAILAKIEQE